MPVPSGASARFIIRLISLDTYRPVAGQRVEFQMENPVTRLWEPLQTLTTNSDGRATGSFTLPDLPGRYRFRAEFRGVPEFRPDSSDIATIEVA